MKILSSREAVKAHAQGKPASTWSDPRRPHEGKWYELFDPGMGADRVYKATPAPVVRAKFKIPRDATFFAAGSCFAREIEHSLARTGVKVLSWTPECGIEPEYFHRYTTHAIAGDFRAAMSDRAYNPANILSYEGRWYDFTAAGSASTFEDMLALRKRVIDVHKRAREADVIILTLGLVETWRDKHTGAYTNIPPWGQFLGDRFELCITDYSENRKALEDYILLMRTRARADAKFIVTVSPVPMAHTFSGDDVVVANSYSKAVLRAVAQDVVQGDALMDYFPSYEMVTHAAPDVAWAPDYRHVRSEFVAQIVDAFSRSYFT